MFCNSSLFFQCEISEVSWPIAMKFYTVLGSMFSFIMPVQKFGACPPQKKKNWGAKNMLNLVRFGPLPTLSTNISGTDCIIQNWKTRRLTAFPFVLVKLGELWSTNYGDLEVQLYPQNGTFLESHISAPRRCCIPKYLHGLQNGQG